MVPTLSPFISRTGATYEEARAVLGICEWDHSLATELFSLYPRKLWTALPSGFTYALSRLPSDVCKKVLEDFLEFFPRNAFESCSQGLGKEDYTFLSIIALRIFVNTEKAARYHKQFAQTLQLGKTVLLPVFQEWTRELRKREKASKDSVEGEAAREHLKLLLNQTLPSAEKANAAFCGIAGDVVNMRMAFMDDKAELIPLHVAAKLGDLDLVSNFLEHDARFDAKDNNGGTALHAGVDHFRIVHVLLTQAEKIQQLEQYVQQVDCTGRTALHYCANAESARLLLRISPNLLLAKSLDGSTVLHSRADTPDVVDVLLAEIKDAEQLEEFVQQVDNMKQTALHYCKNAESARMLLRVSPSLLFAEDRYRNTALHTNASYPSVVEFLLAAIQDDAGQLEQFVEQVNSDDRSALHLCRNAESARLLLRVAPALLFALDRNDSTVLHMNVNESSVVGLFFYRIEDAQLLEQYVRQVDNEGRTALHFCGNAESAQLLLRVCPGLVFAENRRGESALHLNVNDADVVKVLLDTASKEPGKLVRFVEQGDCFGQTALHICKNLEIARLLVKVSPKVASVQCKKGNTPLHLHAMHGVEDVCRFLIEECGADVNAINANGQTPLHLACFARQVRMVALLLKHSAQVLARDSLSRTVLHYVLMKETRCYFDIFNPRLPEGSRQRIEPMPIMELLLTQKDEAVSNELILARDVCGRTALHYCAGLKTYDAEAADVLMMAGANAAAQDERGYTVMHLACENGDLELDIHLVKHWGLSIRVRNRIGETALNLVKDSRRKAELQRVSVLACAVTLRLAARPRAVRCPWKRLPRELFTELCLFLV